MFFSYEHLLFKPCSVIILYFFLFVKVFKNILFFDVNSASMDWLEKPHDKFPEELKQAKWVKEERQRIINDAQKEAAAMIKSTEEKIAAMVNEHDITQQAYQKANQIVDSAQQNSREIRLGANQYADDVLRALEEELIHGEKQKYLQPDRVMFTY